MNKIILSLFSLLLLFQIGNTQITANGWTLSYAPSTLCAGDTACFSLSNVNNPPPGPFMQAYGFLTIPGIPNQITLTNSGSQCVLIPTPGIFNCTLVVYNSPFFDTLHFPLVVSAVCPGIDIISGTVYNDLNGNGMRDTSETAAAGRLVQLNPGGLYVSTNLAGAYSFGVAAGSYTVSLVTPAYYAVTQPVSNSYSVTTAGASTIFPGNDFGIQQIPGINDLEVTLSGGPPVPGMHRYYYVYYRNVGTTTLSGSVDFVHDALMNYVSTGTSPGTYNAGSRTVSWNYTNLAPGQSLYQNVRLLCPTTVSLGTPVTHYVAVNPIVGDTTPLNNVDTLTRLVVGSYDPNDKISFHGNNSEDRFISPTTRLDYRVRFQNTGTYYATDVIILDTLDANLDVSTLEVQGGSHPMNWSLSQERILTFSFMNIMLPDSGLDEPGSHGHVNYALSPVSGLIDGNLIENTAAIYFDFNSPIFTNTHVNEVEIPVISLSPESEGHVKVWPNPSNGMVYFEWLGSGLGNIELGLFDLNGHQILAKKGMIGEKIEVDRGPIPAGVYFWELKNDSGQRFTGKILFY